MEKENIGQGTTKDEIYLVQDEELKNILDDIEDIAESEEASTEGIEVDELQQTLAEAQEDLSQDLTEFTDENGNISREKINNHMLLELETLRQAAHGSGNTKVYNKITQILGDMYGSRNLGYLMTGISKKRNTVVNERMYQAAYRLADMKMRQNKTFKFQDPKDMETVLKIVLPQEYKPYARNFLYRLFTYVNNTRVSVSAISVSQTISNVYALTKGDSEANREFLGNVIEVIKQTIGER